MSPPLTPAERAAKEQGIAMKERVQSDIMCGCGCGEMTFLATQTWTKGGWTKGKPLRFLPGHNWRSSLRPVRPKGYRTTSVNGKHKLVHVLIAETALGKQLPPQADIHHVDDNTLNNARTNLVICQDRAYHKLLHLRALVVRTGGDPDTQKKCPHCGIVKAFADFHRSKANVAHGLNSHCIECVKQRRRRLRETS